MGRNNQNSKWATHQQLKTNNVQVIKIDAGEFVISNSNEEVNNIVPEEKETSTEVKTEATTTILEPIETPEVQSQVPKTELKPIVKKGKAKA